MFTDSVKEDNIFKTFIQMFTYLFYSLFVKFMESSVWVPFLGMFNKLFLHSQKMKIVFCTVLTDAEAACNRSSAGKS